MAIGTTLDSVKELLAKVPNLGELVKEAQKPAIREWSQTAWIYNGFDDTTLTHLGFQYQLRRGELTKIDGKTDYKEIDQGKSSGSEVVWQNLPLTGEFIAGELIYEHGFHEMGFTVVTKPVIDPAEKTRCDDLGKLYKLRRIEEFKVHRDKARAGIVGYKINADPSLYRWMQEYAPDDAMFAEQSKKSDSMTQIAEAIALLTKFVTQQSAPAPAVATVEGIGVPEPAAETVTVTQLKRKPLETEEAYAERCKKYDEEKAKVLANREAGVGWSKFVKKDE